MRITHKDWLYSKLKELTSLSGVIPENKPCQIWQWSKLKNGYGYTHVLNKKTYVHRLALEFKLGRLIKNGLDVCHEPWCHNRACFEPDHLREDTRSGNMKDTVTNGTAPRETKKRGN